jgi:glutamate dehydrogenase/leucine dehydrogenase
MSSATTDVIAMSEKLQTDLRTAAYAVAITRLNDHYTASGLIV